MKYHKFNMILNYVRRIYVNLLVLVIVIALQVPIYHQHVENNYNLDAAPHYTNDYFVDVHGSDIFRDALPEENKHSHNHVHFEKDLFRKNRIETVIVETAPAYDLALFDISSEHLLTLTQSSYDSHTSIPYINTAKTSSGLSPPLYSS